MSPRALCLALLLAVPAAADWPVESQPWTVWSQSKQYVLRYETDVYLTKAELDANAARLKELVAKAKSKSKTKTKLTPEEVDEGQWLRWKPQRADRLSLEKDGKTVWSRHYGVPRHSEGVVTNDGLGVVIVPSPSAGTGRGTDPTPVVWIYGADGTPLRTLRLDELCSPEEREKLMFSVSHVAWFRRYELDESKGQLVFQLINGFAPPMYEQPPGIERRVQLPTGAIVR